MNLFKRTTAIIAMVALVSGTFSTGVSAASSSQVEAANALAKAGHIVDHASDTAAYNLDQDVLRQEIAAVARGVAKKAKKTSCANSFSDVTATTPNTWACLSVEALLDAGLIASNTTFRPEANITKAEAVGMMVKAAFGDAYAFDASKSGTWQDQVVAFAVSKGVVANFSDYNTNATRGFVFEVGNEAISADSQDEDGLLGDLLGDLVGDDNTATPTPATPVVSGDNVLSVTLSANTPASTTVPKGVKGLPVAKFDFTAGSEDVTVTQVILKRNGLSDKETLNNFALFSDLGRASKSKDDTSGNDDEAILTLSDGGLTVKAGETRTLTVVTDINTAADTYDEFSIELLEVSANSNIAGVDSLVANQMRVGSVSASKLEVAKMEFFDVTLGEENVKIFDFEVENQSAQDEDITLTKISFEANDNDAEDNFKNLSLIFDGKVVATTASLVNDYLTFNINEGVLIEDGRTEDFTVKADVVEGAGDKDIVFYVDETLDVTAQGSKYGAGVDVVIDVSASQGSATTTGSVLALASNARIEIEAGEVNVIEQVITTDEIKQDKDNIVVGKFKIVNVSGNNLELEDITIDYKLTTTNTGSSFVTLVDELNLVHVADGTSYDFKITGNNEKITGSNTLTGSILEDVDLALKSGTTEFEIQIDTNKFNASNSEFINDFTGIEFSISKVNIVETEDDEKADVVGMPITFTSLEGVISEAEVSRFGDTGGDEYVKGTDNLTILQFQVEADDSSELSVEEAKVAISYTASGAPTASGATKNQITKASLYLGTDTTVAPIDTVTGGDLTAGVAIFDNFDDVMVTKGGEQKFTVTVDLSQTAGNAGAKIDAELNSLKIDDEDNDGVTAKNSGNALSSGSPLKGNIKLTIVDTGTITLSYNSEDDYNEFAKNILAGEETVVAEYRANVENEKFKLEDVNVTLSGTGNADIINEAVLKIDGVAVDDTSIVTASGATTSVSFRNIGKVLDLGEVHVEVAIRASTIGEGKNGVAVSGLAVSNIELVDARGVTSGDNITVPTASGSNSFAIVPAKILPTSTTNQFGLGDKEAELKFLLTTGNNEDADGTDLDVYVSTLSFELSSIKSGTTGSITVFNGNGDNVGSTTGVAHTATGVTVPFSTVDKLSTNETYRIESTIQGSVRLAKNGVGYNTDGGTGAIFTTQLKNSESLGSYTEAN